MGPFLPIYSTNKPKNQNFEKMKKTPGGIIILHLSTTNDNRIMYGSWDIEFNKQNLFSFWITFCPFTEKSKFSKKKKAPRYHQLTLVYHKWQSYDVWLLRYKVQQTKFFVDYILPIQHPPPPLRPKNLENRYFYKMK